MAETQTEKVDSMEEETINRLVEEISLERNHRRYTEQEQDWEEIQNIFWESKESMEMIMEGFRQKENWRIVIISDTDRVPNFLNEPETLQRYLYYSKSGVNFLGSDFGAFVKVGSSKSLMQSFENLKTKIWIIHILDGTGFFYPEGCYFDDCATVCFVYTFKTKENGGYTGGIPIADGWSVEITGEHKSFEEDLGFIQVRPSPTCESGNITESNSNLEWAMQSVRKQKQITLMSFCISMGCLYGIFYRKRKKRQKGKQLIVGLAVVMILSWGTIFAVNKMAYLFFKLPEKPQIIQKEYRTLPWMLKKPWLIYEGYQPYYKSQKEEYEKLQNMFFKYKDILEYTIGQMAEINQSRRAACYLMEEEWKGNYFFCYSYDADAERPFYDKELTKEVQQNKKLAETMESLGKSGDLMEIDYYEDYVEVKLIDPFFKERCQVAFYYFYEGKNQTSDFMITDGMWMDENWMLYVPYAAFDSDYLRLY